MAYDQRTGGIAISAIEHAERKGHTYSDLKSKEHAIFMRFQIICLLGNQMWKCKCNFNINL